MGFFLPSYRFHGVLLGLFAGLAYSGAQAGEILRWVDPTSDRCRDSLAIRGWTIRRELRWNHLWSVAGRGALPACARDAGPVGRAVRVPVPVVAERSLGVDAPRLVLRRMHQTLGILAAQNRLLSLGQKPGAGVRLAVIDGLFSFRHKALAHLETQLHDAWDYARSLPTPWREDGVIDHGGAVLGLVASDWEELPGVAPGVQIQLYRSEREDREVVQEEDDLAAALERAVDSGAQVVSISLGYRYLYTDSLGERPFAQFDGRTLVASRTATEAVRRGAVVVVAMGNDATNEVPDSTLGSPADADSVLAVGAVSETGSRCGFSSTGPTADHRIKPDVVAFGCPIPIAGPSGEASYLSNGSGTSYATPLVAGMAVLLRQLEPSLTAAEVTMLLKSSGSQADSGKRDNVLGWGMPDLRKILSVGGSSSRVFPGVWRLREDGALVFRPLENAASNARRLSLAVYRPDGQQIRQIHCEPCQPGSAVWDGRTSGGRLASGIYFLRWDGDYGSGASRIIVLP